ncbi:DUF1501 domain-containing protein [Prosthecomicrobium pneumaticum]|uniref:Uncharacterized protein (DUF1501 family) n=1 Tax=Prosthecomicrobium pneumaticum TaxID=81895 RepID=A0A7W9CTT0_9HYPH|nr:DUF1501 domain-containing protein [Prosthecomicrobium pneumaticum]MBB5751501.1 uncharacterized protein (DUF1501 family) [Prosthecomicrobium pneumaticum]
MTDGTAHPPLFRPSRRLVLASLGGLAAWAQIPGHARAATPADPRFLLVILRGALDGLAAVPPIGDPDYGALRGAGALRADEVLPLDGFFALNGAMPRLHARYSAGEALFVHAAATAYRDRSHFDGQDVLESGMGGPRLSASGWLNRAVAALPVAERAAPGGLAVSPTVPLVMRGTAPVLTWTPPGYKPAGADTAARLLDLYRHSDPELADAFARGQEVDALAGGMEKGRGADLAANFRRVAEGAARLLAEDGGPRIAALSFDGWDTHANEGAEDGRLAKLLGALDQALDGIAGGLSPVWRQTVVVVVTEFGRTARINGTEGTDHGTATTALLFGGAVRGGRVLADWPGLATAALYQGRDLAPTTDLRAVLMGVLRDHLGLDARTLATRVFPDAIGVRPIDGLVA